MVDEIKELNPDGVYIIGYEEDIVRILKMLQEKECDVVRMATSSVTPSVISQAGEAAEQLIYAQQNTWDPASSDPHVSDFVTDYKAKYGEEPDIYAAHGYDAVRLIAEAVQKGGGAHPKNVFVGITGIDDYNGAAGRTTFDSNGDVTRFPKMFIVEGGQTKAYDEFVEGGGSVFQR